MAFVNSEELLAKSEVAQAISSNNTVLRKRLSFIPELCPVFKNPYTRLESETGYRFKVHPACRDKLPDIIDNPVQTVLGTATPDEPLRQAYQKKRHIGIVFSGGPAPGGHNVIAGVFDAMNAANPENRLFGFLMGPDGLLEGNYIELTNELIENYRNLGGFAMIRTGRMKIDTKAKIALARQTCKALELDALVIVGGDDSNTNAAFLAQELHNDGIQVMGVPKTIDGDLQARDEDGNTLCAISFGFHTAARAFANDISNLSTDCSSDAKYWHICKVMGRSASHLGLEVGLQVHPNILVIGEELAEFVDTERLERAKKQGTTDYTAYGMTLRHLSRVICDGIVRRAAVGKNYGIIIIPEGVLEFINEIQIFIIKLNTIIADYNATHDTDFHTDFPTLEDKLNYLRRLARLSREENTFSIWNTRDDDLFNDIPEFFQEGLLTERDNHGNFQFSQVQTEKVIMGLVKDYLKILKEKGEYRVGIERQWYQRTLEKSGLYADAYGPLLFKNYNTADQYLLMRQPIVSLKTLKQELVKNKTLDEEDEVPASVQKIFMASVPQFKTQDHFYGYDGRGNDPTWFDCTYAYNLGWAVFSLITSGATGQMAAIRHLEKDFTDWTPIGIPIAPMMHLEERKGKLALVLQRTTVDIDSPAFQIIKSLRETWLAAEPGPDDYRRPGPVRYAGTGEDDQPLTLILNHLGGQ
ncbi:MAG: 6-phosphofructokinase [Desulfobacterales bacterium]|nr:6-phosphofructokinase [Desulfobacterales bacterium]